MRNLMRFLVPALAVSFFSLLVSVPPATAQSGTIIKPKRVEITDTSVTTTGWNAANNSALPLKVTGVSDQLLLSFCPLDPENPYGILLRVGDRAMTSGDSRTLGYFSSTIDGAAATESQAVYGINLYTGAATASQMGVFGMAQSAPGDGNTIGTIVGTQGFAWHVDDGTGITTNTLGVSGSAGTSASATGTAGSLIGVRGSAYPRGTVSGNVAFGLYGLVSSDGSPTFTTAAGARFDQATLGGTNNHAAILYSDNGTPDIASLGFTDDGNNFRYLRWNGTTTRFEMGSTFVVTGPVTAAVTGPATAMVAQTHGDAVIIGDNTDNDMSVKFNTLTTEGKMTYTGSGSNSFSFDRPVLGDFTAGAGKTIDATSGTFRAPNSTSLPGTCTVGDEYFDTDAVAGQNKYGCTATNTWTLQGDGGGSIAFNNISGGTNTTATMIVGAGSSLSASGGTITATSILGSGVSGNITGNAAGLTGTLGVAQGGTNTTSYAQGDILYASAATTLSKLAKSTSADRYLCNTGASNNPAWCQIGLSTAGSFSGTLGATLGGTGLSSGTSGGINYWASTTTQASSALLAANGVVIGGGAGTAPATSATTVNAAGSMVVPTGQSIDIEAHVTDGGSLLLKEGADDGTNTFTLKVPDAGLTASKTMTLVAATGNLPASGVEDSGTASKCARFDASGILVAASGDCSSGGGGTGTVEAVGAGCVTGLCWTDGLATSGTRMWTWEGTTANGFEVFATVPADPTADFEFIIPDGAATLTYPIATDTLICKATTDTLTNKTLNAESTGNVLTTVEKLWLPAAGCNNATAASLWDLPTANAPTPNCVTGTNTQKAYLDFPDSDGAYSAQVTLALPSDWTGAIDAKIKWMSAITTGNVFWNLSTICVADAETDDPAFNTASTVADTAKGTTNQTNDAAITGVTATGCAAGELFHLKISRDRTDGSDTLGASAARLIGVELTLRRAQ